MPWRQHHQRFSAAQGLPGESRILGEVRNVPCFSILGYMKRKQKGYDRRGEHIMMGTYVFFRAMGVKIREEMYGTSGTDL